MGAEQSQAKNEGGASEPDPNSPRRRLQKSNTLADDSPTTSEMGRPVSPPLSVCYDSDLPYISYTDRPIGDSPKIRNKNANGRAMTAAGRKPIAVKSKRPQSTSKHNIVVVKPGTKDDDVDLDCDLSRLRNIPMFLPVMRGMLSSTREPEILERLQSGHLQNICHRMQAHYNLCATQVAADQNHIVGAVKAVDNSVTTLFAKYVDMQKTYSSYAEQFSKIRSISQQLSRCNSLLNENLASLEAINNFLEVDDRLEPFVWKTEYK